MDYRDLTPEQRAQHEAISKMREDENQHEVKQQLNTTQQSTENKQEVVDVNEVDASSLIDKLDTIKKKQMIIALTDHLGIIAPACKVVGISRQTHYNWMATDATYNHIATEVMETTGDMVESKLLDKINKGDTTSIIFYCKTKLKDRGFVEKQIVDNNHNAPVPVQPVTSEEMAEFRAKLRDDVSG